MFRRKDENDPNDPQMQGTLPGTMDPASMIAPAQPAAPANSMAGLHTPAAPSSPLSYQSQPQPLAQRPLGEPQRPIQSPSSFRPAAAPHSDASRARLPEMKPAAAPIPASPVSAAPVYTGNVGITEKNAKSNRRVLTVGHDILLTGASISSCDRLVIEGKVEAVLNDVHTLEIAETGSFKGTAVVEEAEISGIFEGDLVVKNRLIIYTTGRVRGKITYGEIEIERGGEMTGEIRTPATAAAATASASSSAVTARGRQSEKEKERAAA